MTLRCFIGSKSHPSAASSKPLHTHPAWSRKRLRVDPIDTCVHALTTFLLFSSNIQYRLSSNLKQLDLVDLLLRQTGNWAIARADLVPIQCQPLPTTSFQLAFVPTKNFLSEGNTTLNRFCRLANHLDLLRLTS